MESLNDAGIRKSIFYRIDVLNKAHTPLWGTLNANQMVVHCNFQLQIATGELPARDLSNFISRTVVKHLILKYENRIWKNFPLAGEWKIVGPKANIPGDITQNKQALKNTINKIAAWDENHKPLHNHPFFGNLTKQEWGRLGYININHHLRQFGV